MIGKSVQVARKHLIEGKVVAIPTETVYGLAGNAYNEKAVRAIYTIKKRPYSDPLIVHTHHVEAMKAFVACVPGWAQRLADAFWPGALTLLLPRKGIIPDLVTAGFTQVAVRIPSHPIARALLASLDFPLVAPSANPFGYISPTTAQHVADQLGKELSYILDGGVCALGLESTIIGAKQGKPIVYRLGSIPIEAIEAMIGPLHDHKKNPLQNQLQAPGTLPSHYMPHTPLLVGDVQTLIVKNKDKRIGLLLFDEAPKNLTVYKTCILSPEGRLEEAAKHLFAALRELDASSCDVILAPYFPSIGLGKAINDRLLRASSKLDA